MRRVKAFASRASKPRTLAGILACVWCLCLLRVFGTVPSLDSGAAGAEAGTGAAVMGAGAAAEVEPGRHCLPRTTRVSHPCFVSQTAS